MDDVDEEKTKENLSLKKSLSLPLLIFYGVGTMLGMGIYVLLGKIIGKAGLLTPVAFLIASVVALFSGLSFGELSARIPKSAGEMNFVHKAFHKRGLSLTIGWLIVLSGIVSTATAVNGYVGYVHVFFSQIPGWMIIIGIVSILGVIAARGITETAVTITVITLIEVAGLLFIIFVSGDTLATLPEHWEEMVPSMDSAVWFGAIIPAAFLAFYDFIGFEDMANISEEAKNPKRDMPIALLVSVLIVAVFYLIIATIGSLAAVNLAESEAPLAALLETQGEGYGKIISIIALIAMINGVMVQLVMGSRVLYGMAEKKMAPQFFYKLNPKTRTPILATVFMVVFVIILGLSFDLTSLAKASNYILITVFIMCNLSLWVIKRRNPNPEGVRTFPLAVPIIGFFLSVGIMYLQVFW